MQPERQGQPGRSRPATGSLLRGAQLWGPRALAACRGVGLGGRLNASSLVPPQTELMGRAEVPRAVPPCSFLPQCHSGGHQSLGISEKRTPWGHRRMCPIPTGSRAEEKSLFPLRPQQLRKSGSSFVCFSLSYFLTRQDGLGLVLIY